MTAAAFPFAARLHQPSQFHHVFRHGERWSRHSVTVIAAGNAGRPARLGLAVARRHIRRAVDRNRLKRLSREVFRINSRALSGFDLVITPRRGAQYLSNQDFCLCLHALLGQISPSCDTV